MKSLTMMADYDEPTVEDYTRHLSPNECMQAIKLLAMKSGRCFVWRRLPDQPALMDVRTYPKVMHSRIDALEDDEACFDARLIGDVVARAVGIAPSQVIGTDLLRLDADGSRQLLRHVLLPSEEDSTFEVVMRAVHPKPIPLYRFLGTQQAAPPTPDAWAALSPALRRIGQEPGMIRDSEGTFDNMLINDRPEWHDILHVVLGLQPIAAFTMMPDLEAGITGDASADPLAPEILSACSKAGVRLLEMGRRCYFIEPETGEKRPWYFDTVAFLPPQRDVAWTFVGDLTRPSMPSALGMSLGYNPDRLLQYARGTLVDLGASVMEMESPVALKFTNRRKREEISERFKIREIEVYASLEALKKREPVESLGIYAPGDDDDEEDGDGAEKAEGGGGAEHDAEDSKGT